MGACILFTGKPCSLNYEMIFECDIGCGSTKIIKRRMCLVSGRYLIGRKQRIASRMESKDRIYEVIAAYSTCSIH